MSRFVLTPGEPVTLWSAHTAAPTDSSDVLSLPRHDAGQSFSVEISFSADPGNFKIDLQTSDTDTDSHYVTKASVTQAGANASFVCRIEVVNVVAKFARLNVASITNSVQVTAYAS